MVFSVWNFDGKLAYEDIIDATKKISVMGTLLQEWRWWMVIHHVVYFSVWWIDQNILIIICIVAYVALGSTIEHRIKQAATCNHSSAGATRCTRLCFYGIFFMAVVHILMQMEQATLERMFNTLMPKHESDCIIHFSNTEKEITCYEILSTKY